MARVRKIQSEVSSVANSSVSNPTTPKGGRPSKAAKAAKPSYRFTANDSPELHSAAIIALQKAFGSSANRDSLNPGTYAVHLAIAGEVNQQPWRGNVDGNLTVAEDTAPMASSSAPYADLLQSALCAMSASERQAWFDRVTLGWQQASKIPAPDCSAEKAAAVAAETETFLKGLRATHKSIHRGNVSFVRAEKVID